MGYTNSPLVRHTRISPNQSGTRNHEIDTVSIHCAVGQCSAESLGAMFAVRTCQASSNYGVGFDGGIGLYVPESSRSWCTSSASNDNRAITIEVASDTSHPYAVTEKAMAALIDLLTDICRRNPGIGRLRWQADKSLIGQVDKQNMTVHRWFANKACPGDYLYYRHKEIANKVNARLDALERQERDMTKEETTTLVGQMIRQALENHDPMRHNLADVPQWWREDVAELVAQGAIQGDGKNQVEKRDSQLACMVAMKRFYEKQDPIYRTIDDVPDWGKPYVQAAIDKGGLQGETVEEDGTRILNIRHSAVRLLKMLMGDGDS